MARRCPESRYMGIGYLHGYRFQINQRGYANVIPSPDDVVAGLCYLLSAGDEARLDVNEGVAIGCYEKEPLVVEVFLAKAVVVGRKVSEIIRRGLVRSSVGGGGEEARMVPDPFAFGDQISSGSIDPGYSFGYMPNELGLESHAPVSDQQPPATGQQSIERTPKVAPRGEPLQSLVYVSQQYTTESTPKEEYVDRMNLGITDALTLGVSEEYVEKHIRKYIPL